MPKNNMDQAPYIKSNGVKKSEKLTENDRKSWGFAMRPHELESILFNLIDTRNVVQLKVMLFLTGNAEGYQLVQANTLERLGISKDPYYKARAALEERGWITVKDDRDKTYIMINYDKIYQDGAEIIGIKKEGNCENTSDESNCNNTSLEEGNCENTSLKEKESTCDKCTDESTFQNTSHESTCEKTPHIKNDESTCDKTSESTFHKTSEGNCDKYYNSISNKINNKISEVELKAKFDAQWNDESTCEKTPLLTGPAAMF